MALSPQQMAELGALLYAAEESALNAYELLHPPGGILPGDDNQRAALAQANALAAFALVGAISAKAQVFSMADEPAEEPPAEEPVT